jgi:hypothetical protein
MERHDLLVTTDSILLDSAVGTSELIALAVSWGICGSASEFWQVHKGRDELLVALYDHQAQVDAAVAAVNEPVKGHSDGVLDDGHVRQQIQKRRNSLLAAPAVFGNKEYSGDQFSTRGEYTDGMIYASRQPLLDVDEKQKQDERMMKELELTRKAKEQHRRSSIVQGQIQKLRDSAASNEEIEKLEDQLTEQLMTRIEIDLAIKNGTAPVSITGIADASPPRRPSMTVPFSPIISKEKRRASITSPLASAPTFSTLDNTVSTIEINKNSSTIPNVLARAITGSTTSITTSNTNGHISSSVTMTSQSIDDLHQLLADASGITRGKSAGNFKKSVLKDEAISFQPESSVPLDLLSEKSTAQAKHLVAAAFAALPPDVRLLPSEGEYVDPRASISSNYEDEALLQDGPENLSSSQEETQRPASQPKPQSFTALPDVKKNDDPTALKPVFREEDSVQMRRIKSRMGEGEVKEPLVKLTLQETYHVISQLMEEERRSEQITNNILDGNKVPSDKILNLSTFVSAHRDEVTGITGGLAGTIRVNSTSSVVTPQQASALFSPVKSMIPVVASKPMIDRSLSKVDLYFKSVSETKKDVFVLEALNAMETAKPKTTTRLGVGRIEWGGGKPINTAESKIDCHLKPKPKFDGVEVQNDFNEREFEARRAAAERSKQMMKEIRAIERELLQRKTADRATRKAPGPRSPVRPGVTGLSSRGDAHAFNSSSYEPYGSTASHSEWQDQSVFLEGSIPNIIRPEMPPSSETRRSKALANSGRAVFGSISDASAIDFGAGVKIPNAPHILQQASMYEFDASLMQPSLDFSDNYDMNSFHTDGLDGGPSRISKSRASRGTMQSNTGRSKIKKQASTSGTVGGASEYGPPGERDPEFDAVAKKLARLRTAELKVHGEMRLLKAYGSSPIKLV